MSSLTWCGLKAFKVVSFSCAGETYKDGGEMLLGETGETGGVCGLVLNGFVFMFSLLRVEN